MANTPSPWTIAGVLTGVAASSWVAALTVSRVAATALTLPDGAELVDVEAAPTPERVDSATDDVDGSPVSGKPRKRAASTYVDPIVRRSIFDSSQVDKVVDTQTTVTAVGEGVPSDLKVVLLATMVADPPEYSSALIAEEKGGDGALGYGIGASLLGEGEIVRIEPRKVYIKRHNGSIEFISMEQGQSYVKETPAKGPGKGEEPGEEGVTKEGPNKFIVDQELVEKLMENPEQLYSQVRATPHKGPDGGVDGYRLSGIRRNSVFYKLGIKNGDVVHTVNGKTLDSMSSAMTAYNSLQAEKNFTFEVTRRNKRETFEYEVR